MDWDRRRHHTLTVNDLKTMLIWMPISQNPTGQMEYIEELSKKEKAAEEAMLRLRLLEEGLNTDELASKFGEENVKGIIRRLDEMVQEGLLIDEGSRYRLTAVQNNDIQSYFCQSVSYLG